MSARLLVEPSIDLTPGKPEVGPVIFPCAKEHCAWWDNEIKACVVHTQAIELIIKKKKP